MADSLIWAGNNPPTIVLSTSFRPDPELLDERPPFLDLGLLQCAECLRCLLLAWINVHTEISEPRSHRWICQCFHGCRVEPIDYLPRRALGREKRVPTGDRERRQSHLAKGRDV